MRINTMLAAATLAAGVLTIAHESLAEEPRIAAVREGMRDLDARAQVVKGHAAKSSPKLKQETDRIMTEVQKKQSFVSTRLDIYNLLGKDRVDEAGITAVEAPYRDADKLLATVESWYQAR